MVFAFQSRRKALTAGFQTEWDAIDRDRRVNDDQPEKQPLETEGNAVADSRCVRSRGWDPLHPGIRWPGSYYQTAAFFPLEPAPAETAPGGERGGAPHPAHSDLSIFSITKIIE